MRDVVRWLSLAILINVIGESISEPPDLRKKLNQVFSEAQNDYHTYKYKLIQNSDSLAEIESRVYSFSTDRSKDHSFSQDFTTSVMRVAYESGFDPFFMLGLLRVENDMLDADIKNSYGAVGLAQVVERLHLGEYPECGNDLTDIYTNLCYGMNILQFKLDQCRGNMNCALWNYNGCTIELREAEENCVRYPERVRRYFNQLSEADQ